MTEAHNEPTDAAFQISEEALVGSQRRLLPVFVFAAAVNYKGDQPTAWRSLLDGEIGMGVVFGVFWFAIAFAFGALVASIFGIIKQLLWRVK